MTSGHFGGAHVPLLPTPGSGPEGGQNYIGKFS